MDCIMEHLYIGSRDAANNLELLKEKKITHILIVAKYVIPTYPDLFKYKAIPAQDLPTFDLYRYFKDAIDFIHMGRCNGNVLVHCMAGVSRSSSIIIAYAMNKKELSFSDALTYVSGKHYCTSPNPGFISQLKKYDKELQSRSKKE